MNRIREASPAAAADLEAFARVFDARAGNAALRRFADQLEGKQ